MDEKIWNNEFLARCAWPRELFVDGMRLRITDELHAAYWDENGKSVMLADTEERHAMELALLPDAEQFADFPDGAGAGHDEDDVAADDGEGDGAGSAPDISAMKQAEAMEAVASCSDAETLRTWLMSTRNNQLKGAIRARLAEVA